MPVHGDSGVNAEEQDGDPTVATAHFEIRCSKDVSGCFLAHDSGQAILGSAKPAGSGSV